MAPYLKNKNQTCHQCGKDFVIHDNGISTHINENETNSIDYNLDLDHVAYEL
jgi:hypothetical protein